jgi:hypothetical protein
VATASHLINQMISNGNLAVNVRRDAISNFSLRLSPNAAKREDGSDAATLEHIQKPFFADRALGFSISKCQTRELEIRFRMRSTYLTADEATAALAESLGSYTDIGIISERVF